MNCVCFLDVPCCAFHHDLPPVLFLHVCTVSSDRRVQATSLFGLLRRPAFTAGLPNVNNLLLATSALFPFVIHFWISGSSSTFFVNNKRFIFIKLEGLIRTFNVYLCQNTYNSFYQLHF